MGYIRIVVCHFLTFVSWCTYLSVFLEVFAILSSFGWRLYLTFIFVFLLFFLYFKFILSKVWYRVYNFVTKLVKIVYQINENLQGMNFCNLKSSTVFFHRQKVDIQIATHPLSHNFKMCSRFNLILAIFYVLKLSKDFRKHFLLLPFLLCINKLCAWIKYFMLK